MEERELGEGEVEERELGEGEWRRRRRNVLVDVTCYNQLETSTICGEITNYTCNSQEGGIVQIMCITYTLTLYIITQ